MPKRYLPIVNEVAAEILVHGPIGKSFWSDEGITGKEFSDALNKYPVGTKVTIGVNSQGGAVGEGLTIYNAIQRRSADVTVRIDGYALSIASVFPLAANKVISPESSIWMIHNAWGWSEGNAEDMRRYAELLDTHDEVLVNAYVKKTGKTQKAIEDAMAAETWLTGKEAVDWGLADETGDNAVDLAALDFSAAPAGTFKNLASTLNRWQTAGVMAALKLSAPQGGATNQTKGQTMNRTEILALLKTWGVKVADDATDEWLKAEVAKGKPAAAPKIEPLLAENPLEAKLKSVEAQLEKARKRQVTLQIDNLILEDKVTVAERDAEIELCMMDENRLANVLAKRIPNLPGAAPLRALPYSGDEGAYDHVMAIKSHRGRFDHMRDNWNELRSAGFRRPGSSAGRNGLPVAANTTDTDLVTQMLVEGATTILQNRLAPLRAFSKEVSIDRIKPKAVLQHRKITAGGTGQTNATSFEDLTNFVGTEVNVPITMAQLTVGGHLTNAERQNGVTMAQWVEIKVAEMGDLIMSKVAAVILEGTYTATPLVTAAIAFGGDDLATLWGQLKKSTIHNIILDGEYYAQFLPTDRFDFDVTEFRNRGWDNFLLNTYWTGATANTVGFACNPQALVCGVGLPLRSDRANNVSTLTTFALPGIGVAVDITDWYSNITRNDWTTYDVMFGAAANDDTAGILIKSS